MEILSGELLQKLMELNSFNAKLIAIMIDGKEVKKFPIVSVVYNEENNTLSFINIEEKSGKSFVYVSSEK